MFAFTPQDLPMAQIDATKQEPTVGLCQNLHVPSEVADADEPLAARFFIGRGEWQEKFSRLFLSLYACRSPAFVADIDDSIQICRIVMNAE